MDKFKPKQIAASTLQSFNRLLWPAVCINCKTSISQTDNNLCKDCWDQLLSCTSGDYCRRCGKDVSKFALLEGGCGDCSATKLHFEQIARSGIYKEALRKMILSFKKDRTELDDILALLANSALAGSGFYNQIELFIPVPLHWFRRLLRGYNQSKILAEKLNHPSAKINTELVRIRHTKQQSAAASPSRRKTNVAGAFAVRRGHKLGGRKICLVDDIKTSGATLNECAKTLKKAGASKVFALVLAVAGQDIN